MSIVRCSPIWNDFAPTSFSSLVDRFFNDSLARTGGSASTFVPQVDIVETEKAFEVQLAVPGVKKEDFKVNLNDHVLTISGERKLNNERSEGNVRVRETQYGTFSRSFNLPDDVKSDAIDARYNDGILEITIPKDTKKVAKATIAVK